ncbi:hypothetical protein [Streptomyces sp. NRRL F-5126]|uniref:hypothetical protein n=1 Tax=Streptomyces sp. NRRL F-5126 TaxID=1463857 RepID=UPI000692295D|nr:hypothetical protein [Streptomyces sp. NRRL F-5126]
MEPRDYWDRNAVLAEAFCACDEQVRQAQAVLDERQVERSRTLAAFAITVGDDGTVAHLMGLGEREVRLARRTVGKTDARDVAQELLARPPQPANRDGAEVPAATAPQQPQETTSPLALALGQGATAQQPQDPALEPEAQSPSPLPHQRRETLLPTPASQTAQGAHEFDSENTVSWSPSMDSVLVWSWRSNLDLHTVAAELGLDLRSLLLRTQTLAEEGRLGMEPEVVHDSHSHAAEDNQPGRHRRHYAEGYATFANTTAFPAYS